MEDKLLSQKSQRKMKMVPDNNTPLKSNIKNNLFNNSNIKVEKSPM